MPKFKVLSTVLVSIAIGACSAPPATGDAAASSTVLTACQEPRPQICTADYTPVCAKTGGETLKTYSNACSACSDSAVSGHRPGACE